MKLVLMKTRKPKRKRKNEPVGFMHPVYRISPARSGRYIVWGMGSKKFAATCAFLALLLPIIATAEAIPAGFPAQPIWVSTQQPTAGDSVNIFTVVYNGSTAKIQGTVLFTVDGNAIGTKQFALDAGTSAMESVSWKAVAGAHTIAASIDAGTGVALANAKTDSIRIEVAAAPPPSQVAQSVAAVSNIIGTIVASSTPFIANAAQNTFQLTEAVREGAAQYFQNQLEHNSGRAADADGPVLGVQTERADDFAQTAAAASPSWWRSGLSMFDRLMLALFSSVAFFYPLLALVIFIALYIVARRVRRNPGA